MGIEFAAGPEAQPAAAAEGNLGVITVDGLAFTITAAAPDAAGLAIVGQLTNQRRENLTGLQLEFIINGRLTVTIPAGQLAAGDEMSLQSAWRWFGTVHRLADELDRRDQLVAEGSVDPLRKRAVTFDAFIAGKSLALLHQYLGGQCPNLVALRQLAVSINV